METAPVSEFPPGSFPSPGGSEGTSIQSSRKDNRMFALGKRIVLGLLAMSMAAVPYLASPAAAEETTVNRNIRFGMPAPATADPKQRENFLISRAQYVLSYNDKTKTPNWVSWHLTK